MRLSDETTDLANCLATDVFCARMADFVAKAITHCQGDLCPLTIEQQEQLYRAAFEAGDGVGADIARGIERHDARFLIASAGLDDERFPYDPELGR